MGKIIKMGGKYFEWSEIVDALAGGPFDLEGLKAYVLAEHGARGVEFLTQRLECVEAKGTSSHLDASVEETVWLNRAGPGESCLSVEQIEALYVRGEAPRLSVFAFVPGEHEKLKAPARPVVAYCEADAAAVFDRATESETQRENWRLVGPAPDGAKRGAAEAGR